MRMVFQRLLASQWTTVLQPAAARQLLAILATRQQTRSADWATTVTVTLRLAAAETKSAERMTAATQAPLIHPLPLYRRAPMALQIQ